VFGRRCRHGLGVLSKSDRRSEGALGDSFTLMTAAIAVAAQTLLFGVAASCGDRALRFPRQATICLTLIDIPFSVSPVNSGLDVRDRCRAARSRWADGTHGSRNQN